MVSSPDFAHPTVAALRPAPRRRRTLSRVRASHKAGCHARAIGSWLRQSAGLRASGGPASGIPLVPKEPHIAELQEARNGEDTNSDRHNDQVHPERQGQSPWKTGRRRTALAIGPLNGLKLIGFVVWERSGAGRTGTFPARQYSMDGERRSYALLRPILDTASQGPAA